MNRHTRYDHARRSPRLPSVTIPPDVLAALRAHPDPASHVVTRALRRELGLEAPVDAAAPPEPPPPPELPAILARLGVPLDTPDPLLELALARRRRVRAR